MEHLFHQLNRHIGKSNSLQIIVLAIGIHSCLSIVMIYLHLVWYFNTDVSKHLLEHMHSNAGGLVRLDADGHMSTNLISNNVMSSRVISNIGWWRDHSKWSFHVDCFNSNSALCQRIFSTKCKSDRIRAIYQYIPIPSDTDLKGFDIHLRATAQQLLEQSEDPFYGMIVLIKFVDGSHDIIRLKFPSELGLWTKRSAHYSKASNSQISSLTVILMCLGYSGSVSFADVRISPKTFISRDSLCFKRQKTLYQKVNLKIEKMAIPNGGTKSGFKALTFVSQVSMDRLVVLERSLQSWNGPVSLTIYVPVKEFNEGILEWQRIYILKKLRNLNLTADSHVNIVTGINDREYPINSMRNIAIENVKTKYMFLSDADFQPSPELEQQFLNIIGKQKYSAKTAFVVPAFEYLEMPKKGDTFAKTKEELLQLLHRERPIVQPFRVFESTDSHRLTDYWRWYYASETYKVNSFSDKYEPYLIIEKNNDFPYFDERLKNYGMNKVIHTTELFAANFVVLHNVWMTHLPHKTSHYFQEFLQNIDERLKNRAERFEVLTNIIDKYGIKIENCNL